MTVPASVKKQAKLAEKLQKELSGDPAEATPAKTEPPAESATPAESTLKQEPIAAADDLAPDPNKRKVDQGDWEERFKRLKTSTDAEKHRSRTERKDEIADAVRDALADQQRQAEQNAQQQQELVDNKVTDEEISEYGPELLNLIERVSKGELAKKFLTLSTRMDQLEQGQTSVVETSQKTAKQNLFDSLSSSVPNWRKHNNDPLFNDWLDGEMPGTGYSRRSFLDTAYEQADSVRVASFFTDWEGQQAPSGDTQLPDNQIMPANSRAGGGDHVVEPKMYTGAEVNQFYRDKREGRYRGREEEARRIENDIILAGTQGRVI